MAYRIKHKPTGLYLGANNILSKNGKIYKKEGDNILEKEYSQEAHGNKDSKSHSSIGHILVRTTEKSQIYKITDGKVKWNSYKEPLFKGMFWADIPKEEFEIERI